MLSWDTSGIGQCELKMCSEFKEVSGLNLGWADAWMEPWGPFSWTSAGSLTGDFSILPVNFGQFVLCKGSLLNICICHKIHNKNILTLSRSIFSKKETIFFFASRCCYVSCKEKRIQWRSDLNISLAGRFPMFFQCCHIPLASPPSKTMAFLHGEAE